MAARAPSECSISRLLLCGGPFLTSPLAPRGEICPLGVKFTPSSTPRGKHYCLEEWRGEQRISPPGATSPLPRGQIHPWGTTSPLGDNFTPRGQIHPWGTNSPLGVKFSPGVKLRMGLWGLALQPLFNVGSWIVKTQVIKMSQSKVFIQNGHIRIKGWSWR
jgi:hypothetical protein